MYITCPVPLILHQFCIICTTLADDYRGCWFSMMHIFTVSNNVYRHNNLTFTVTQLSLTHSHTSRFLLWVWMMKGSLHILRRSPWGVETTILSLITNIRKGNNKNKKNKVHPPKKQHNLSYHHQNTIS